MPDIRGRRALELAAVLTVIGAGKTWAEPALESVHWQVGRVERGRVVAWQDVNVLQGGPPKLINRLRVRLVLKNRGSKPAEGVLLRYSITARLTPDAIPQAEGTWAIPFFVDEKHVPFIGSNKTLEVPLETTAALDLYLRHLARAGWWPDRLKMQVMLEPHPGSASIQTGEDVLGLRR